MDIMQRIVEIEQRIARLEANRGASLRFGTVTEAKADGSARVQLPDGQNMVSGPLRTLQRRTMKDKEQCLPDLGEQVAVLFSGQGLEEGCILGSYYNAKNPGPGQPNNVDYTRYEDGTEVFYDRKAHTLTVSALGNMVLSAIGNINLKAGGAINVNAKSVSLPPPHESEEEQKERGMAEAFSILKEAMGRRNDLTADERIALCMSDIAAAEAMRCTNPNDAIGWEYLSVWMRRWFLNPANEDPLLVEPFWVSWDWVLEFEHVKKGLDILSQEDYLFNEKAKLSLASNLLRDKFLETPAPFDYTTQNWPLWKPAFHQRYDISTDIPQYITGLNGFEISIGSCELYALPKGYVETIEKGYRITVTDVVAVLYDKFGFDDFQILGQWDCEKKQITGLVPWNLENETFQRFRQKTGLGEDFLILAPQRPIDLKENYVYELYL